MRASGRTICPNQCPATWRQTDNNANNRITYVDGLGQSQAIVFSNDLISGSTQSEIGADCNASTGAPVKTGRTDNGAMVFDISATNTCAPALGLNFAQEMENPPAASTLTFNGNNFYEEMLTIMM